MSWNAQISDVCSHWLVGPFTPLEKVLFSRIFLAWPVKNSTNLTAQSIATDQKFPSNWSWGAVVLIFFSGKICSFFRAKYPLKNWAAKNPCLFRIIAFFHTQGSAQADTGNFSAGEIVQEARCAGGYSCII